MTEWKTYRLGDICTLNYGKSLTATNRVAGDIPVYSSAGITGSHNVALVQSKGIIVGRKGTVGTVYYSDKPFYCIDTAYYILPDDEKYDFKWLYYRLKSLHLDKLNEDSAVPGLNRETAYAQEFPLPPLEEQRWIAGILGAIDDKIENNRRINTNLELQAQALYKQWFVDNRSDDWEEKKLSDFFNVVTGKKDANFSTKDGVYPFFTCSQDVLNAPDYSFEGAAILLAGNGDFNVKRYIGKFEAYQRTYVLIPFDRKYHSFLYLTIKYYLQEITGGSRGSVIKFITKGNIADFEIAMPRENSDDKLAVLDSIYQSIDGNTAENNNLATLRDTLLPKLMSGELSVDDVSVD